MAEGFEDECLCFIRLLDHAHGLPLTRMPAETGMQSAHVFHGGSSGHVYARLLKTDFDQTQIAQGHNAGENMAGDLAVGPVPDSEV